ncbi:rhodanese-like domain-containing protein [Bacillus mesophilus]|uniref:Rhodanese-like domain-containing protein n=1 Tax=Bacillus mesophilus TaxID=1808955 RepID=A0A6M0QBP0_9BACI|nr:rhodanese-like domain-containing protein [Bacillus mesophilus]NEY73706.1 rhodanese-like domain-containing protein [Bacillus mesophilus]
MEYINYLLMGLVVFFIINRMLPAKGVRQISTVDLKNEIKDKHKQFVDVRTTMEYKGNHIKGFKNLPLHQLTGLATKELTKEKEVVVICQSGMRSQKASKLLKKLGYTNVTNVKGGMSSWRQ